MVLIGDFDGAQCAPYGGPLHSAREVISDVRRTHLFEIVVRVLLPDHMHCIWQLSEGDTDYSKRWGIIQAGFTRRSNWSQSKIKIHRTATRTKKEDVYFFGGGSSGVRTHLYQKIVSGADRKHGN